MSKSVRTERRAVAARGWGWEGGSLLRGDRVSGWSDEKVLQADGGDGRAAMRPYLVPLNCTLKFKVAHFICTFYHNTKTHHMFHK